MAQEERTGRRARPTTEEGLELTQERIEAFLADRERSGCKQATLSKYRHDLMELYRSLPQDKHIRRETLPEWRRQMEEEAIATLESEGMTVTYPDKAEFITATQSVRDEYGKDYADILSRVEAAK